MKVKSGCTFFELILIILIIYLFFLILIIMVRHKDPNRPMSIFRNFKRQKRLFLNKTFLRSTRSVT